MSRLLYEKHVPADPLLAPLFADMPSDQPQRLAGWLAGALGGPAGPEPGDGRMPAGFGSSEFGEEQRARWAVLATTAADESGLPADAAFRSVLASCLEWLSRTAVAQARRRQRAARADTGCGDGVPVARPFAAGTRRGPSRRRNRRRAPTRR